MLIDSKKSLRQLNEDYIEFNKNIYGRKHYIQFNHGFIRGWNAITGTKLYHWVHADIDISDLVLYLSEFFDIVWDSENRGYYNVLTLTQPDVQLHYQSVVDYFNQRTAGKQIVY